MKKTNYLSALCISLLFSLSASVFVSCDKDEKETILCDTPEEVYVINIDNAEKWHGYSMNAFWIPQEGGTYRFVTKKSMLPDPSLKDKILPLGTAYVDDPYVHYDMNVDWAKATYKNDTITCTFTPNERRGHRSCKTQHHNGVSTICTIKFIQKGEQE